MAVFATAASADDASEPAPSGTVSIALDGQQTGSPWPRIIGGNHVGFRIPNVTVAQGTTIGSAILAHDQLQNYSGFGDLTGVTLYGQAADNAAQFAVTSGDISGRARTTANVAGSAIAANSPFSKDVTSIVQEILNRAGWVSGNAMAFLFISTGAAGNFIQPYMWDYFSGTYSMRLTINMPSGSPKSLYMFQAINRAGNW